MQQSVKNYITPAGIERLRAELHRLRRVERPEVVATVSWAAGNGDRSENGDYIYGKRRLRYSNSMRTVCQRSSDGRAPEATRRRAAQSGNAAAMESTA